MNEKAYKMREKSENCTNCTKIAIKQFQNCKNVAKNIFIKYP